MKTLATILFCLISDLSRADIVFAWTNCPNHLAGSATIVWQGTERPLNYSTSYTTTGTNFAFSEGWLHDGMNYFACQQIATNHDGSAMPTPFSGEIQVKKIPSIKLELAVLTSTNLGSLWSLASTDTVTVTFPTTDAQRFYLAQIIKSSRAAQIVLPPTP